MGTGGTHLFFSLSTLLVCRKMFPSLLESTLIKKAEPLRTAPSSGRKDGFGASLAIDIKKDAKGEPVGDHCAHGTDNNAADNQRNDNLLTQIDKGHELLRDLEHIECCQLFADLNQLVVNGSDRRPAEQQVPYPVIEGENRGDGDRVGDPGWNDRCWPVEVEQSSENRSEKHLDTDSRSEGDKGAQGKTSGNGPGRSPELDQPAYRRPQFKKIIFSLIEKEFRHSCYQIFRIRGFLPDQFWEK